MSNSVRPNRDSNNPSSNRMPVLPRFPMLRMGSRISLEDGTRATIVGTGNILGGNGGISLLYIIKVDITANYTLVNVENIDPDGRFIK